MGVVDAYLVGMPLAILVYDLPEEQDEFEEAQRASRYAAALNAFCNKLRGTIKHGELADEEHVIYERVREWLADACEQYDVETL